MRDGLLPRVVTTLVLGAMLLCGIVAALGAWGGDWQENPEHAEAFSADVHEFMGEGWYEGPQIKRDAGVLAFGVFVVFPLGLLIGGGLVDLVFGPRR